MTFPWISRLCQYIAIYHENANFPENRKYVTLRPVLQNYDENDEINTIILRIENYVGCNKDIPQIQLIAFLSTVIRILELN